MLACGFLLLADTLKTVHAAAQSEVIRCNLPWSATDRRTHNRSFCFTCRMIAKKTAFEWSNLEDTLPKGGRFRGVHFRLLILLICVGTGFLSVALGPDNYWDLRYYHLYAPWAYLHHRYLYDVGPAQEQGFLNPTADLFLYGMIMSPLNEAPRVVAFIMGIVHGINAAVLFAISCHVICPIRALERWTLRAAAWLIGVSGAGFVSLVGTSSNDLTSSLFVLASLLGVLKTGQPIIRNRVWYRFAGSGVLAGIGIGLKYTSAVYAPGLGAIALVAAVRRRTAGGLVAFGAAALLGFIAVAGHHMYTLWHDFGNPTFPYLNQIFQSPYWEPIAIRDARFIPQDFWKLVLYPFYLTIDQPYVVVEPALRDWREAIAYISMVVGITAFAISYIRNGYRREAAPPTRDLDIIFIFAVVSYFCWALGFGYYRYAVPLEMLTGIVTIGSVIWLFESCRSRVIAAIVLLVLATTSTVYPDWGRRRYGDRYVDVRVPMLPEHSVVLIATWDPVAFFVPYAEPTAQFLGIENNYLELSQNNKLATEVKRLMRTPGRPKFILNVDKFDGDKLNGILGQFGLRLGALPCQPILTNLEGHALALCRVADN